MKKEIKSTVATVLCASALIAPTFSLASEDITYRSFPNYKTSDAIVIQSNRTMYASSSLAENRALILGRTLSINDTGHDVQVLQQVLQTLGYYTCSVDSIFGSSTKTAVEQFQSANGLAPDGKVGDNTCAAINAAVTLTQQSTTITEAPVEPTSAKSCELLDWPTVDTLFPRKTTAVLIDVWTGTRINIYRLGGTNHVDAEPLTATDTELLGIAYPSWSWNRRPVIVEVAGHRIAGSMNGMPHGKQDILNNNYNGQFCIHFLGSRTHNHSSMDADHQAMVHAAFNSGV